MSSVRLLRKPGKKLIIGAGANLLTEPHVAVRVTKVFMMMPDGTMRVLPSEVVQCELEVFAPDGVAVLREEILIRQMFDRDARAQLERERDARVANTTLDAA